MTEILPGTNDSIHKAAKLLAQGEIVALPTETVYGLAGNAFLDQAVKKIFTAKERPSFDPLIVHISDRYLKDPRRPLNALVQDGILAPEILLAPELARIQDAITKYWPGPLTLILPRGPKIPDSVTSSQPTVGIRCPDHPIFQAVLAKLPFPLAAPSANRFGRISPTEASHVLSELNGRIPAILDGGPCSVGVESTILKIDFPFSIRLLRPGKIGTTELESVFQTSIAAGTTLGESRAAQNTVTPGSLDEHYAPRKPLYLMPHYFADLEKTKLFFEGHNLSKDVALLTMGPLPKSLGFEIKVCVLSELRDLNEIAQNLFRELRELDEDTNVNVIVSELPPHHELGIGAAIADRLRRASRNKPNL